MTPCLQLMALTALALATSAQADPVGHFGNTLVITRDDGSRASIVYRADHHYTMVTTTGVTVDGGWNAADGKLCLKPDRAALDHYGLCVPDDPVHRRGDVWSVATPDGKHETLTLVAIAP